jgi:hypothetical protein
MSAPGQKRTLGPLAVLKKDPATARDWLGAMGGARSSEAVNCLSGASKNLFKTDHYLKNGSLFIFT